MLSCYFQEKQRSFTSGDFWVLPRWQVTHFQFLSVFQDGGHVKFPTLGKARLVNFPWVARPPPPPPTLGLNIDRCINCSSSLPPPTQLHRRKATVSHELQPLPFNYLVGHDLISCLMIARDYPPGWLASKVDREERIKVLVAQPTFCFPSSWFETLAHSGATRLGE